LAGAADYPQGICLATHLSSKQVGMRGKNKNTTQFSQSSCTCLTLKKFGINSWNRTTANISRVSFWRIFCYCQRDSKSQGRPSLKRGGKGSLTSNSFNWLAETDVAVNDCDVKVTPFLDWHLYSSSSIRSSQVKWWLETAWTLYVDNGHISSAAASINIL